MGNIPERWKRLGVAVIGVAWLVIGGGYLFRTEARRAFPDLVGWLFVIAGVCLVIVAARPAVHIAFRLGGAFTVCALLAMIASLSFGLKAIDDPDAVWAISGSVAFVTVTLGLFWWFWLYEVKPWHEGHRRGHRARARGR